MYSLEITSPHVFSSDLSHWAQRWQVNLASWSDVALPNKTTAAVHNVASKAYFGDYWRFWLLGVLKNGTYGVSVGEIMNALQKGANSGAGVHYSPQLGFKHWKVNNFISWTDLTQEELREAFDLPINVTVPAFYDCFFFGINITVAVYFSYQTSVCCSGLLSVNKPCSKHTISL